MLIPILVQLSLFLTLTVIRISVDLTLRAIAALLRSLIVQLGHIPLNLLTDVWGQFTRYQYLLAVEVGKYSRCLIGGGEDRVKKETLPDDVMRLILRYLDAEERQRVCFEVPELKRVNGSGVHYVVFLSDDDERGVDDVFKRKWVSENVRYVRVGTTDNGVVYLDGESELQLKYVIDYLKERKKQKFSYYNHENDDEGFSVILQFAFDLHNTDLYQSANLYPTLYPYFQGLSHSLELLKLNVDISLFTQSKDGTVSLFDYLCYKDYEYDEVRDTVTLNMDGLVCRVANGRVVRCCMIFEDVAGPENKSDIMDAFGSYLQEVSVVALRSEEYGCCGGESPFRDGKEILDLKCVPSNGLFGFPSMREAISTGLQKLITKQVDTQKQEALKRKERIRNELETYQNHQLTQIDPSYLSPYIIEFKKSYLEGHINTSFSFHRDETAHSITEYPEWCSQLAFMIINKGMWFLSDKITAADKFQDHEGKFQPHRGVTGFLNMILKDVYQLKKTKKKRKDKENYMTGFNIRIVSNLNPVESSEASNNTIIDEYVKWSTLEVLRLGLFYEQAAGTLDKSSDDQDVFNGWDVVNYS